MRRHGGFTLLELLLASALSVLLMVGVLAVIATWRTADAAPGAGNDRFGPSTVMADAETERWVALLREDLGHARQVEQGGDALVRLVGHAGLDAVGRARTHRPVEVVYRTMEQDGAVWLVREQAALDIASTAHRQRDLVAAGVLAVELTAVADDSEDGERDEAVAYRLRWRSARTGEADPAADRQRPREARGEDAGAAANERLLLIRRGDG